MPHGHSVYDVIHSHCGGQISPALRSPPIIFLPGLLVDDLEAVCATAENDQFSMSSVEDTCVVVRRRAKLLE